MTCKMRGVAYRCRFEEATSRPVEDKACVGAWPAIDQDRGWRVMCEMVRWTGQFSSPHHNMPAHSLEAPRPSSCSENISQPSDGG